MWTGLSIETKFPLKLRFL